MKILLTIISIIVFIFIIGFPLYSYFSGNGPSYMLDFLRQKEYVDVDVSEYHEKICSELGAKPELRSRFDPTGMPSFDGVCVTLTKIYYLK